MNPTARTKVVWINSWYDPTRERQAADALIGQGADVLYQNTDSPAVVQFAQTKGLYAFGALNPAIPPDVLKLFNEKKSAILAGSFHPFQGVVKDQAGKVKVAAGQVISEAELWGMKWHIEGVEGALP